jgi:hypothetical protein
MGIFPLVWSGGDLGFHIEGRKGIEVPTLCGSERSGHARRGMCGDGLG